VNKTLLPIVIACLFATGCMAQVQGGPATRDDLAGVVTEVHVGTPILSASVRNVKIDDRKAEPGAGLELAAPWPIIGAHTKTLHAGPMVRGGWQFLGINRFYYEAGVFAVVHEKFLLSLAYTGDSGGTDAVQFGIGGVFGLD
jgi:hypothetical protein